MFSKQGQGKNKQMFVIISMFQDKTSDEVRKVKWTIEVPLHVNRQYIKSILFD